MRAFLVVLLFHLLSMPARAQHSFVERYNMLRRYLPRGLNNYIQETYGELTDYESGATYEAWKAQDVQTIYDSLFARGGYLSYFDDSDDYLGFSEDEPKKNFKRFLETKFPFDCVVPRFLNKPVKRETLNLMRFLIKVASRCGGCAYAPTQYRCHSIPNASSKTLMEADVIEEGEWIQAGYYSPKWSFVFDDSFISGVSQPITDDIKKQGKNENK